MGPHHVHQSVQGWRTAGSGNC